MQIEVFIYGCTKCGINGLHLARLKKVWEVKMNNSLHQPARDMHVEYLKRAGIEVQSYPPIIVIDGGKRIMRLSEWKSI